MANWQPSAELLHADAAIEIVRSADPHVVLLTAAWNPKQQDWRDVEPLMIRESDIPVRLAEDDAGCFRVTTPLVWESGFNGARYAIAYDGKSQALICYADLGEIARDTRSLGISGAGFLVFLNQQRRAA